MGLTPPIFYEIINVMQELPKKLKLIEIADVLGVKRQRLEYLQNKLFLEPSEKAQAPGGVSYYSWVEVLEMLLGHILNQWGFAFSDIRKFFKDIKEKHTNYFSYDNYKLYDWKGTPEEALIFYVKMQEEEILIKPKTYDRDLYLKQVIIEKYKNISQKTNNFSDFVKEKGSMVLNLHEQKDYVIERIKNVKEGEKVRKIAAFQAWRLSKK